MATKPTKPRRYTPEQIKKMNDEAQGKIDKVNEESLKRTKRKLEDEQWKRKYKRGLV